jgi:hypothetical protein
MIPQQKPYHEPEIIPPGHADRASMRRTYRFVDPHGAHRISAMQIGPFGLVLLAVVIALVAALMLLVILGAVLLWIPLVILLVAVAAISGLLRRQRPTHWR